MPSPIPARSRSQGVRTARRSSIPSLRVQRAPDLRCIVKVLLTLAPTLPPSGAPMTALQPPQSRTQVRDPAHRGRTIANARSAVIDVDSATIVGPVFCCISEQFIQNQRQRHRRLLRWRPGRFVVDRYFLTEENSAAGGFVTLPLVCECALSRTLMRTHELCKKGR